jgi:hypothetical protein
VLQAEADNLNISSQLKVMPINFYLYNHVSWLISHTILNFNTIPSRLSTEWTPNFCGDFGIGSFSPVSEQPRREQFDKTAEIQKRQPSLSNGSVAQSNDRPDLSSEGPPDIDKTAIVK